MIEQTRICRHCGKTFTLETGHQVFCTPDCRRAIVNKNKRLKRAGLCVNTVYKSNLNFLFKKRHLSITEAALFLNVSRPHHFFVFGNTVSSKMPLSGIFVNLGNSTYLLRNNTRYPNPSSKIDCSYFLITTCLPVVHHSKK